MRLLADRLADAPAVADIRWRDWGYGSQPTDLAFWLDTTLREAGRDKLPVTYVAYDADDVVLGAVGMDHHDDIDEWHESDARRWRDVTRGHRHDCPPRPSRARGRPSASGAPGRLGGRAWHRAGLGGHRDRCRLLPKVRLGVAGDCAQAGRGKPDTSSRRRCAATDLTRASQPRVRDPGL